ncbi:Uncharacterised protein [Mycobacteroides abscessus subsp. abscessus]|nr:Uncharacterised protein [Mycobacteroides abscessus subsp. abscessus]
MPLAHIGMDSTVCGTFTAPPSTIRVGAVAHHPVSMPKGNV